MKKSNLSLGLRPARDGDQLDAHRRAMLVNAARRIRANIEQVFSTAAHWNRSHPEEQPIDVDPDGEMRRITDEIDTFLLREQPHKM